MYRLKPRIRFVPSDKTHGKKRGFCRAHAASGERARLRRTAGVRTFCEWHDTGEMSRPYSCNGREDCFAGTRVFRMSILR
jgi:hypothetical protein